jgi:hypothetical protein
MTKLKERILKLAKINEELMVSEASMLIGTRYPSQDGEPWGPHQDHLGWAYLPSDMKLFLKGAQWRQDKLLPIITDLLECVSTLVESKWFVQDVLARVNEAIATDCPSCDYQCHGCINSADDAETMKNKISTALAKLESRVGSE